MDLQRPIQEIIGDGMIIVFGYSILRELVIIFPMLQVGLQGQSMLNWGYIMILYHL